MEIDLKEYWSLGNWVANERHKQKKSLPSHNPMSDNYELVGVLGEMAYSLATGQEMDYTLRIEGDNGTDFRGGINVKTSEKGKGRHLIEYMDKEIPPIYVYVLVDIKRKKATLSGWIRGEDFLKQAEVVDFGYGKRYAITIDKLSNIYTFKPIIKRAYLQKVKAEEVIYKVLKILLDDKTKIQEGVQGDG